MRDKGERECWLFFIDADAYPGIMRLQDAILPKALRRPATQISRMSAAFVFAVIWLAIRLNCKYYWRK